MTYHAYNRGAHKALIFHVPEDYQRFQKLLYLGNSSKPLRPGQYAGNVFSVARGSNLVDIFAYCLMPNHFHIVLTDKTKDGVTSFMRKICTSYSMYYNVKYKHSGTLFQGDLKKKIVEDERYLYTLINYVHLNPYGIEVPELMKEAKAEHIQEAFECSRRYKYSSFSDYLGEDRPERAILKGST